MGQIKVDATGEGSRGGKVIGRTSSGKPIYAGKREANKGTLGGASIGRTSTGRKVYAKGSTVHEGWTKGDHEEAAAMHNHARAELERKAKRPGRTFQ